MADGRNRLVLGRERSNESDDARVKPEVFRRTTAREHQRMVVRGLDFGEGGIQGEVMPGLLGIGLVALEVVDGGLDRAPGLLLRTDGSIGIFVCGSGG